jgi:hypothetical protein
MKPLSIEPFKQPETRSQLALWKEETIPFASLGYACTFVPHTTDYDEQARL